MQREAACVVCANVFSYEYVGGRNKRFCSGACQTIRSSKRLTTKNCDTCGKSFFPRYVERGSNRGRFCSMSCRRKPGQTVHTSEAEQIRRNGHVRRARLKGATVEQFKAETVFQRDGWLCALCGGGVDQNAAWPNKMMATLDHIVPLALGGDHSMANTQLAHWLCNSRRTHLGPSRLQCEGINGERRL